MWREESTAITRRSQYPIFSLCCNQGNITLAEVREPPEFLKRLLQSNDEDGHHFLQCIRTYNALFCFTSMGGKVDHSINNGGAVYIYSIGGQIFHRIGSLIPPEGQLPKFGQLYIHDTENEVSHRMNSFTATTNHNRIRETIVEELGHMLDEHNNLVKAFRYARNRLNAGDVTSVKLRLLAARTMDGREYDLPTVDELAGLIVDETGDNYYQPDIIVEHQSAELQRLHFSHPSLMALQYPMLFPYGEDGWHGCIYQHGNAESPKTLSQCDFYAYRIQTRMHESTHLLLAGKLFQQYVVNAYAFVEAERLEWMRNNQTKLRAHYMTGLVDAYMRGDTNLNHSGKRVILASSLTGSPRHKYENFQDATAICRWGGYPDLFITFTCNSQWPEIDMMVNSIRDTEQRDPIKFYCVVVEAIEFQKRGLPHAHMLLFLAPEDKIHGTSHIDSIISAEIPDPVTDPLCYKVVEKFMLHGPCGRVCLQGPSRTRGKCSKHFPKPFSAETTIDEDGYPRYRRREDDRWIMKNNVQLDNRFVVPYNRYLLLRFNAHINVEFCNKSRAIKYLFKYINKPPDRAKAAVVGSNIDEIKAFMDCRYITPGEACWRLFKFELYANSPAVRRLSYHLPGEQIVYSRESSSIEGLLESELSQTSMLIEWMKMNVDSPHARQYTYVEFPQHYVWISQAKKWRLRKRGISIARLYYCHPSSKDRFYLRMLLHVVKGCTSFDDIKTVNGIVYKSFKDACGAYGFLSDDGEWNQCLQEVANTASARQMRTLFATMLMYCEVSSIESLWEKNWELLSDDILYMQRKKLNLPELQLSNQDIQHLCLIELEKILRKFGRSLTDFSGFPDLETSELSDMSNSLLAEEMNYDRETLASQLQTEMPKLNAEQRYAFDQITDSVYNNKSQLFFIEGFGGTGKTFLWKVISMNLRAEKKVVLCVATSGIAALLMTGGRTAHSRFHIPIDCDSTSTCHIQLQSPLADLIRDTSLIIWDEAPMAHKHCIEALDRTLRDVLNNDDLPFGGLTMVFGGDFRQILPVIPKATRTETVNSSIKRSYLWPHFTVIQLHQNMRLKHDGCNQEELREIENFSKWLLDIGDGKNSSILGDSEIQIPYELRVQKEVDPIADIVHSTYPDILQNYSDPSYLAKRAVLAPLHDTVSLTNEYMLNLFPGREKCYYSSDSIQYEAANQSEIEAEFPPEFLNSLRIGNFPDHELKLKVGVPVILLRNIDQSMGLCNGTRAIVRTLGTWSIEIEIITGSNIGDRVYLPRMTLSNKQKSLNFTLLRRQYPLALSFAMTINKSQGQTLQNVGLCLKKQVFTHGQLYVALSRVTTKDGLKIISCDDADDEKSCMKNIVFQEIFN
ncbi:ATP-dependent DNA helicase PIF1 [Linum perenne]